MTPSLEQAKAIAQSGDFRRIPLSMELFADRFTTIEVLRTLRAASHHCFLLESAEDNQVWGRYSFLGYDPQMEITCRNGRLSIRTGSEDEAGDMVTSKTDNPAEAIRRILQDYRSPKLPGFPPFTGGLVGCFSYDYIKYAEPTLSFDGLENDEFNDVDLMLFDRLIVFDNFRQKLILIAGTDTENLESSYEETAKHLKEMADLLTSGARAAFRPLSLKEELKLQFSKEEFCGMVRKAKQYIHEGDIFQVVLSNPLTAKAEGSLLDTYRVLRTMNPSPYMFYFTSDDVEIAGASPETLVKLTDGKLFNYPLAGTRPRGKNPEEDRALETELLSDEKERAEHNMLVDLGRNDIGRVSRVGSVRVESYMDILRFSHVMHIGSTVTGQIREDCDALDAVSAILPAGTLSGAPKIRACEIISELEGRKRGIYGGAIGYLDFAGNMDICIAIRLAYKKNGMVCVQSGAGIVADSIPENEFEECRNKAMASAKSLQMAEGGIL